MPSVLYYKLVKYKLHLKDSSFSYLNPKPSKKTQNYVISIIFSLKMKNNPSHLLSQPKEDCLLTIKKPGLFVSFKENPKEENHCIHSLGFFFFFFLCSPLMREHACFQVLLLHVKGIHRWLKVAKNNNLYFSMFGATLKIHFEVDSTYILSKKQNMRHVHNIPSWFTL